MSCDFHEPKYYGCVNIYDGEELVKVIEAWRCVKCGAIKAGARWFGEISSSEGLLEYLHPSDGRWLVIVTTIPKPDGWPIPARPGDVIAHEGEEYLVTEEFTLVTRSERRPPSKLAVYRLEEVIKGYIDLSTWPPTKFSLASPQT